MLLNKAEVFKALSAYEGKDKNERSVATLKTISEEFVTLRKEFEEREAAAAEKDKHLEALKTVIQNCNSNLSETDAKTLAEVISNMKVTTNTKRGERLSSDIFEDILRYLW